MILCLYYFETVDMLNQSILHGIAHRAKIKVNHLIGYSVLRRVNRLGARFRQHIPEAVDDIWINIDDIYGWLRGGVQGKFPSYPGQVKGGNWDRDIRLKDEVLRNSEKYAAIRERYVYGLRWRDTSIKQHYAGLLKRHGGIGPSKDFEAWADAREKLNDELWERLQGGLRHPGPGEPEISPIYVHFDRHGRCLFTSDGNHRLFMALILDYNYIPVRVWLRHKCWQDRRLRFWDDLKSGRAEVSSLKGVHPDLAMLVSIV